jgi:CYTH domain-containing protein
MQADLSFGAGANADTMPRKYAQREIERRWLVPSAVDALIAGAPFSDIEDRYVLGTRVRLRTVHLPDGSTQWKFCKKYPRAAAETFGAITNLYLTGPEFEVLAMLPCAIARKRRYRVAGGSIDVYTHPKTLAVFEVEFDTEAAAASFVPPPFVGREITGVDAFSGAALAGFRGA